MENWSIPPSILIECLCCCRRCRYMPLQMIFACWNPSSEYAWTFILIHPCKLIYILLNLLHFLSSHSHLSSWQWRSAKKIMSRSLNSNMQKCINFNAFVLFYNTNFIVHKEFRWNKLLERRKEGRKMSWRMDDKGNFFVKKSWRLYKM